MDLPSTCKSYNLGILETLKHCLKKCKFMWRIWWQMESIREELLLNPRLFWHETLTSVIPRRKRHQSYRHNKTVLNIAWDMLRVAILWHIWCAQSMAVFRKKIFNVVEVCLLAWRNTIYAGMESHSRLLSTINSYCSERYSTLCSQFNLIGVNNKFSIHAMLEIPSGSLY